MEQQTQTLEKKARKTFRGRVVSDGRDKTIAVAVEIYVKHPLYGKRFRKIKKFHAHDENEQAKKGDLVEIVETRPLSRTKAFRLVNILEVAKGGK